jgi:hypothetical protein
MADKTHDPKDTVVLGHEELEFLWVLCYSVTQGQLSVHKDYEIIARRLEPLLYQSIKRLLPGWESPLKQTPN